jgi:hypothetical protein
MWPASKELKSLRRASERLRDLHIRLNLPPESA